MCLSDWGPRYNQGPLCIRGKTDSIYKKTWNSQSRFSEAYGLISSFFLGAFCLLVCLFWASLTTCAVLSSDRLEANPWQRLAHSVLVHSEHAAQASQPGDTEDPSTCQQAPEARRKQTRGTPPGHFLRRSLVLGPRSQQLSPLLHGGGVCTEPLHPQQEAICQPVPRSPEVMWQEERTQKTVDLN